MSNTLSYMVATAAATAAAAPVSVWQPAALEAYIDNE